MKTILEIIVSASSKKPRIEKILDIYKFFLKSPAKEGKANKELIKTISELLRLPSSEIKILQGHSNKKKIIEINSKANRLDLIELLSKHISN